MQFNNNTSIGFHVLSVDGWEEHIPIVFYTVCNSALCFDNVVTECIDKYVETEMDKENQYVDGRILLDYISLKLEGYGYHRLDFNSKVTLWGGCMYRDRKGDKRDKPEIMSDDAFAKIVEHNNKIDNRPEPQIDPEEIL